MGDGDGDGDYDGDLGDIGEDIGEEEGEPADKEDNQNYHLHPKQSIFILIKFNTRQDQLDVIETKPKPNGNFCSQEFSGELARVNMVWTIESKQIYLVHLQLQRQGLKKLKD